jgi:hypothetical protein
MLCDECQTVEHCTKHGCIPVVYVSATGSALDKQVSGNHYKDKGIQPIVYIHANDLGFCEGNVVKYVTRHKSKNGAADIKKAIHYLELLLELEYKDENTAV